jgi:ribonucleoside-triphosphate reductase
LFRPRLIAETIVNETGVDEDLARKIQNRITQKIYKLKKDGLSEVTTSQIRSEVSAHLLQEREFKAEEKMNKGVFIKESEILGLLTNYDNNNANQAYAAGALEYSLFELVSKKALNSWLTPEWVDAVEYGITYGHDAAQYVFKGINCWVCDARMPIRKGLRTYGDNNIGVVSGPPKHFTTVLELIEQTLGLASTYIAGGVAVASMSTFVAPFMDGLSDDEIKQAIQGFLFQCNQAFKNRGSQSMFSSIVLDLEMPDFLKEQDAYGPGGKVVGKYKDFEDNAKKFIHILAEVSLEGDAEDKPLFFPNLIFNIDGADLNEWIDVFELSAKFSSPYFCSAKNNNVEYESTLGCRSAMPSNWTGDPNIDCMGTGNSVYTTVILPAVALKSQEDGVDFYQTLDYSMDLVRDYNKKRLEWIKKLWYDYHVADFMIQEDVDGVPFYRLEDATIVLGYLGLSECLEILGYGPIYECNDKAQEIMKYMANKIATWKQEDELRWGLFQTPAENLCYTAAQKMVERFGFKKSHAKGTEEAPFYTNSNHVPVDADINLIERIKIEGSNQPIGPAGNIMNVYLGESYSEASALKSLCEKIRDNTNAYFWAFTGDYSICPECHSTFKGVKETCPFDNNETDVYSRVTGYLTNVKTWNKGKRSEFKVRYRY